MGKIIDPFFLCVSRNISEMLDKNEKLLPIGTFRKHGHIHFIQHLPRGAN